MWHLLPRQVETLWTLFTAPVVWALHFLAVYVGAAGAVDMRSSVDDRLRRIDRAAAEGPHIGILALGVFLAAQRILPPQIVPVVDMVGERDDARPGGELGKKRICRRAGAAALAGEQLDYAQRLFRNLCNAGL